jgi:hypothetical protein
MEFITKHWLGSLVLVSLIWLTLAANLGTYAEARTPALIFIVLFPIWALRGFVRFLGRAWRHGAKTS